MNILNRIQSPETILGKSLRDAVVAGLAAGAVVFLQTVDAVDFGQYEALISAFVGFGIAALNRTTRTVKREK